MAPAELAQRTDEGRRAAHVTDGGDAGSEGVAEVSGGLAHADRLHRLEHAAARDVDVGVDQPGQEQPPARVEHVRPARRERADRDPPDPRALDGEHGGLLPQGQPVEPAVGEDLHAPSVRYAEACSRLFTSARTRAGSKGFSMNGFGMEPRKASA